MATRYLSLALLVLAIAPACKKKSTEAELSVDSKRSSSTYALGEKKLFDEEIDAFVLEEGEDPFAALGNEEGISFALVDEESSMAKDEAQRMGFKTIYFDFDSYEIRQDQEDSLALDAQKAQSAVKQGYTVVISGHACNIAKSHKHNMDISEGRASRVKDFFVSKGIPANKVKTVGRGCEMPIINNGSKEQQAPNRRTEFIVIKD